MGARDPPGVGCQAGCGGSLAATHDLQLLLTDSVMPRMSGQTLAEHITETRPELPVVYMSGYSETPDPPGTGRPGIGRIQKPFNSRTLLETIHTALHARPEPGAETATPHACT